MVNFKILKQFHEQVPAGKRSDFINKALEKALTQFARQKAAEIMDSLIKNSKTKISTKDFLKEKNNGRL